MVYIYVFKFIFTLPLYNINILYNKSRVLHDMIELAIWPPPFPLLFSLLRIYMAFILSSPSQASLEIKMVSNTLELKEKEKYQIYLN